jgi:hypothetical protein
MKANRHYRLLHTRAGRRPAPLDPTRIDHIEVVDIASGEVVLFWDLAAPEAARGPSWARRRGLRRPLVRRLRHATQRVAFRPWRR